MFYNIDCYFRDFYRCYSHFYISKRSSFKVEIDYNRVTAQLRTPRRFLTMKGRVKKDKKTGKYFYIVDIGIDPLTGKRKQKKKRGFFTKKEAENALAKLLSEVHTWSYVEPTKLHYG